MREEVPVGIAQEIRLGFLLAGDCLRWAFARSCVGMGSLTAHWKSTAVAKAPVAAKVHEAFNVHRRVAAKVAFDHVVTINRFTDLKDLGIGQLVDATLGGDLHLRADFVGKLRTNAVYILKRDDNALLGRNVYACDTSHVFLLRPLKGPSLISLLAADVISVPLAVAPSSFWSPVASAWRFPDLRPDDTNLEGGARDQGYVVLLLRACAAPNAYTVLA
jgi:hypothetical protein